MRVLVAGGTGRLGTLVVQALADRGVDVRVLTRDRRRAAHLDGAGAEIVEGDVRRPDTLPTALTGVDVVVSAVHGFAGPGRVSLASVDRDGNSHLVAAAKKAGAAVVMVSIVGAAPDSPLEHCRYKYVAEQGLQRSGAPWTIVRSTAFVELWAEIVGKGVVFGRGDMPINFVSVHDVADVVAQAVLDPGQRGRIIDVGGPQSMSLNALADSIRQVGGRTGRIRHVPRWLLRAMAPLHRLPRAALVLDTVDMTFVPKPDDKVGKTDVRQALARSVGSVG
jgi:uncharacterized protein YbjT (DUF2867 family)